MSNQQTPAPLTEERLNGFELWIAQATLEPCTIARSESWPPNMYATVKRTAQTPYTTADMIGIFTGPNAPQDALFNAQMREAAPLMLAEIHRLRAKVAEQADFVTARAQTFSPTESLVTIGRETPFPCAKCGGAHRYQHYMATLNPDGTVAKGEWVGVGCTGPKAPTDGNQGEGAT